MAADTQIRHPAGRIAIALAAALVLGAAVGLATSYGQGALSYPWAAIVNAASPWLLIAFVAGSLARARCVAIGAGLFACVAADLGYYVTTAARGYAVSNAEIAFWTVCAVIGGPLFGAAAWTWRHDVDVRHRAVGAAFLPATFLGEAIGTYALRLHYYGSAVLYVVIGALCAIAVAALGRVRVPVFLLALVVVTIVGALAYGLVLHEAGGIAFG